MTPTTCTLDGCDRKFLARGVCNMHYVHMSRYGSYDKPQPRVPEDVRFWSKVDKTGDCWEWAGGRTAAGRYGTIRINGKATRAHRAAVYFATGVMPPPDVVVCHSCDNTLCVRFDHLFLGTQADNIQDMWAKDRGHDGTRAERGEDRYNAKLSEVTVREARQLFATGVPLATLAARFQVDPSTVRLAVRRKTWKHVA